MKKDKYNVPYIILAVISVAVVFYALFTRGLSYMHSDCAIALRIFNSIVEHGHVYPKTWLTFNGEIYTFHTDVIAFFVFLIMGTTPIARVVASAISIILTLSGVFLFYKKYLSNNAWVIAIPILTVFICSDNIRDMMIYQAAYNFVLISLTTAFQVSYLAGIEYKDKKILFLNIIMLLLMGMEGVRFIAEFAIPFFGTSLFVILKSKESAENKVTQQLKRILLFIAVPFSVGYIIYLILSNIRIMNNTGASSLRFISSMDEFVKNIKDTCLYFARVFGYDANHGLINIVITIFIVCFCLLIPILQLISIKKENLREQAYIVFGVIHNVIMLGVVILASKTTERYVLSSIFVFVIISSHYIWKRIVKDKVRMIVFGLVFTVLTIGASYSLINSTRGWKDVYSSERLVGEELTKRGITKGYASYWNAYTYEIYSDNAVRFGAVHVSERQLQKYYLLVDETAFEKKAGKSCIILTEDENERFSYAVNLLLGPPEEYFEITDIYAFDFYNDCYYKTNLSVYVFPNDVCDDLTNGLWDNVCDIWEMDFNWVGTMTQDYIVLSQGGIVHGPYSYLAAGKYKVRYEGKDLEGCDVAIISENTPEFISFNVLKIDEDYIEVELEVDKGVDDIQFYLMNNVPEKEAIFYNVTIE